MLRRPTIKAIITMTNSDQDIDRDGQSGEEVKLTPAMIEAGVYAAKEHCIGEGLEELVRKVFLAMRTEELYAKSPGILTRP